MEMIEQIKSLQLNKSVVIEGTKKDVKNTTDKLPGNYLVSKVSYNQCVVVLVESAKSFTQQLYKYIESIKPFEKKTFTFESIEYARTLVSEYNKKNNRLFKVSHKSGVTTIYEDIMMLKEIDMTEMDKWKDAFNNWLSDRLV